MDRLFTRVLAQHKPGVIKEEINVFLRRLNTILTERKIEATAMVGGSVAKGTHLYSYDCDIFVVFSRKYQDDDLSLLLAKAVAGFRNKKVLHGSRDYFQILHAGIIFELIPVLQIKSAADARNVTDVSPLHVEWVNSHIKNLQDNVRLAKLFCKAQGIYGAESYINGFSGYTLEILVIMYGGFLPMLKAVSSFHPKQIIDIAHYYASREELLGRMNAAKLQSPLIVVDPVQSDRNAAAAVNEEQFSKFIIAAKLLLQKPSPDFFIKKSFSLSQLHHQSKTLGVSLLLFSVIPVDGKEDVVGSKLIKAFEYITNKVKTAEFHILNKGWQWGKEVYFWYFVYPKELPRYERHIGPLVYSANHHIVAFIKKHKSFIVENNRLIAFRRRKYNTLAAFAKGVGNDASIKEKVKKIKSLT